MPAKSRVNAKAASAKLAAAKIAKAGKAAKAAKVAKIAKAGKAGRNLPAPTRGRRAPIREFSRSLPMLLLRGREAVMRHFRPSLRAHGLSEQQWRILRALASVAEIEVAGLARTACLLGPSLSRMLRDLEARRLIERRVPKADLRRGIVTITRKGLRLIETVAPTSEAIYAEIATRYGAGKLAALQEMLRDLETSLLSMPVAAGARAGNQSE